MRFRTLQFWIQILRNNILSHSKKFSFSHQAPRHHNKFLMKVHKAGDLPLMQVQSLNQYCHWVTSKYFHCQEDKSTWTKIESTSSDMVTRFVSIKGEKTDAKDGFRDLPVGESKERVALFLATIPDYFRGRLFYVLGRWKRLFPPGVFNFLMFILQFIMQVMEKIRNKKLEPVCDCKKDCVR